LCFDRQDAKDGKKRNCKAREKDKAILGDLGVLEESFCLTPRTQREATRKGE
jgi:hypothetical protein